MSVVLANYEHKKKSLILEDATDLTLYGGNALDDVDQIEGMKTQVHRPLRTGEEHWWDG